MTQLEQHLSGLSPLAVAAYMVIVFSTMAVLWRLSVRWRSHGVAAGARVRELLALVLATVVGLGAVTFAQNYFQRQADIQRLQAELKERNQIATVLRSRIDTEVDAVRAMLAERTVRNIERNTLTKARADLARFAALKDPRITQMLVLIDTELEIRALVAQTLQESDPKALARVYGRLSELVPDNQEYRDKATQFAAASAKETN